ncbi:MAG: hypothetical protein V4635_16410 [Bacteroidota bacterium]
MKTKIIGLLIVTIITTAFTVYVDKGKIVKVDAFKKFIDPIGLKFEMPPDFEETLVKENKDLWYSFAIKDKKADFEIRYTVWSLKPTIADYKKCKLDSTCRMVNPNTIYEGRIQSNVLNMTGGQDWDIGAFPPQAVKKEFNADNGGSSFFEFHCGFGTGYKYGQMIYLHKDDVGDVIITYMSNDKEKHPGLMMPAFHSLTFK